MDDGSIMTNKTCNACHNVTVDGTDRAIADKTQHIDGTQDVDVDATYGGSFAAGDCTTVYCHSNGQTGGGRVDNTATWGTPISDCVSCHEGATVATDLSGAHEAHVVNAVATVGMTLGCVDCHNATVSDNTTISTPAQHVDGGVDVADCSTNVCHSNGNFGADLVQYTPNFASDTYDCDSCHGDGAGKSHPTYANVGPADDSSNSHVAHVETSLISCEECHADTTTAGVSIDGATPAQHVDGGIDVTFKQTGSYVDGTDTCSTTYCHGAGTPVWGGGAQACDACHNASNALANSHGAHYGSATVATAINANNDSVAGTYVFQCGNCHDSTTHAGGAVNAEQAAEVSLSGGGAYAPDTGTSAGTDSGFSYTAGTCGTNACHNDGTVAQGAPNTAAPQWTTTLAADCTGCHDNNAAATPNIMASNAHGAHVNDGSIMTDKTCNTCHNVTVDGTDRAIADKSVHINGTQNVDIIAGFDGGNTYAANSCDAVYCHSDGKATAAYATIDWTTTIGTCTGCHGGAGGNNGGASTALSTTHTVHTGTNGTTQFAYTCDDCHSATATNSTTIGTAANHVNQTREVSVLVANGGTGTIGGDFAAGSCATTNCHGSVSADWTAGGTTGDCSLCHGMAADTADGRDTAGNILNTDAKVGAHVAHLTAASGISAPITCNQCHVDPNATAGSYMDQVNTGGHMNGTALMTWGTIADGNDDGQSPVTPAPVSCATTYCHDSSKIKNNWGGAEAYTLDWATPKMVGGAADCDNCHGYPPTPASGHPDNSDCIVCHDSVNADNISFTAGGKLLHIDGVVYASGGDSCTDCHNGDIDGALFGVHDSHTDHATFLSGKTISGGNYGDAAWYTTTYVNGKPNFGCGQCHPAAEGVSHPTNGLNIDIAQKAATNIKEKNNAVVSLTLTERVTVTCSSVYCHSDADTTSTTFATTPDWYNDPMPVDGTKCGMCHNNGPASGTHANHTVGIHYETLYNGASGLMASGSASDAAHGDAATADTIGCQSCHNNTVAVEINDQNSVCATCHDGGTAPFQGNMTINTAGSTHVNGTPDVVFDNFASFKSKAQVRDDITTVTELNDNWTRNNGYKAANSFDQGKAAVPGYAAGSCSNIACHNGIATPTWNTGFAGNCRACHTTLP
jgi:predicted CxxxxCH...CXXCH cytochrome family protein